MLISLPVRIYVNRYRTLHRRSAEFGSCWFSAPPKQKVRRQNPGYIIHPLVVPISIPFQPLVRYYFSGISDAWGIPIFFWSAAYFRKPYPPR